MFATFAKHSINRIMFNFIRLGVIAISACALLASCNEDGSADVRDAAFESVANVADAGAAAANNAVAATTEAVENALPTGPTTVMTFAETDFNFGTVAEGEKVSHTYKFKNTGDEPLILSNAKGSCGCTVPKWPREPIPVGGTGEVVVEFNSQGKVGDRNQKVTITANTNPATSIIMLSGKVEAAAGGSPLVQ